jgi:hypothetical protein
LTRGGTGTSGSQSGHDAAQSHADPEYRRAVAAAGRSAFADALQCGADAILAKAAGEPGIGSVFAQTFQGLLIFGAEADGDISQARNAQTIGCQWRLNVGNQGGLDVRRASGNAEHGPLLGGQFANHAGTKRLENLFARPIGDQLIAGLSRAHQLQNHGSRVADFERVFAEHSQTHGEPGLRILDVIDGTAEGQADELPRADEVQLSAVHVAAAGPIHDVPEERK